MKNLIMSIIKIYLPIRAFPKPRGQLNKHGKLTHSLGGYRQWQTDFKTLIDSTPFYVPSNFHSVVFRFGIPKKRGHAPDLSNLQGGVEDALVKSKYLHDDNWKILTRYYTFGQQTAQPSITLYVAGCKKELLYIIEQFSD